MVFSRHDSIGSLRRRFFRSPMGVALLIIAGCPGTVPMGAPLNPFRDLPAIPFTGEPQPLTSTITPLGIFAKGEVFDLFVMGTGLQSVLILTEDQNFEEAGVIAGGGRPDATIRYRVQVPGRYFAFTQFDPQIDPAQRVGTISIAPGDPAFRPPQKQNVQIHFAEGFLHDPGLFDPVSGTEDEQDLLESISDQVAGEIVDRLRTIFAGAPIEILVEGDPLPAGPVSQLTFLPDRVLAENQDVTDAALPPPDPSRPECAVRVIFGELLPRGSGQDPGNQVLDDEAIVYVGSFQGRGESCRTAATDSVNNIVLSLAQTGAHEIGHLVGLYHTELIDVMNRSATLAFQRELEFERGQIQIEGLRDGQGVTEALTTVIQDPTLYFQANFEPPPAP
jgi:hypothetical protein